MIPKERRLGWQYWEVADLIREGVLVIGDGYRAKNSEMGAFGLPFARAGNLNNGFHFEDSDILSEVSVRLAGEKISQPGDITFTSKGTFGRFAIVRENTPPFVYSPQLCYWRVKRDGIVARTYLYYWMQGEDCMNQLNEVKGLTDMADYVSLTNQRRMWLSAPPLSEQKRIAGILSAYDELIENSQRRIRILESMTRALYREWFVNFRFPGHENHPRVSSPLGDIPQGWEVQKLGDVLELNYGKALKKESRRDGMFPVYGSSGIVGMHDKSLVKGPGIIVGRKGNVGSVFWCDNDFFVIDTAFFVISTLPLRFLYFALPTLNFINSDAAVPGLSRNQAYTLEILVPPEVLLKEFSHLAGSFKKQVSALQLQTQNLRRTRDLLLPRLLTGQVNFKEI
ncbi:MAG: hypothetical protein HGA87_02550 [Desulfobulbaceae bacterium]|nr:hypothetical protein [Desulfobulbaceae bacterium]